MFYGVSLDEADGINLVKFFKEQGYVTGHTGTTCGKEIFSVNGLLQMQHLDYDNWDHENIAMFCDPNFFDARYPIYKGVASVLKRCLYGNYAFEYMIEYAKQFWNKYPDNKKFFRIHFNEGHEGSMELVSYMADPFFEFVKYFFDNNLLNDTFMFIVSDHGNHMLGPWAMIRPQDYLLETTLATLCFVIPNNAKLYKNGLYDNIHNNQQTLVTPYDIHDTLIHIAYGTDKPDHMAFSTRGSSLLLYINPKERYCENPDLDYQIAKIVLGYPINLNGTISKTAEMVLKFKKLLEDNLKIEVVLYDERFSTQNTTEMLKEFAELKNSQIKKIKDKLSAQYILQQYIDLEINK
jgi:putative transcription antitermination factor YqgF